MKKIILSHEELKSAIRKLITEANFPTADDLGGEFAKVARLQGGNAEHNDSVELAVAFKADEEGNPAWFGFLTKKGDGKFIIGPGGSSGGALPIDTSGDFIQGLEGAIKGWYKEISSSEDALNKELYAGRPPRDLPKFKLDPLHRFFYYPSSSQALKDNKWKNAFSLKGFEELIIRIINERTLNGKLTTIKALGADAEEGFENSWAGVVLTNKGEKDSEGTTGGGATEEKPESAKTTIDKIEAGVNKYITDHAIDKTTYMTVDGEWVGENDDNAWAHFVTHALGTAGAHPAKKVGLNINLIATNWSKGGPELGYTGNPAGALKFVQDAKQAAEVAEDKEKKGEEVYTAGTEKETKATDDDTKKSDGEETKDAPTKEKEKKSELPERVPGDIVVRYEGSIKKYDDKGTLTDNIRNATYEAMPAGKKVRQHFSVSLRVGVGGRVKPKFSLRPEGFKTDAFNKSISDAITGLRKTKGKITIKIPPGRYTKLNEVKEFIRLLKTIMKD